MICNLKADGTLSGWAIFYTDKGKKIAWYYPDISRNSRIVVVVGKSLKDIVNTSGVVYSFVAKPMNTPKKGYVVIKVTPTFNEATVNTCMEMFIVTLTIIDHNSGAVIDTLKYDAANDSPIQKAIKRKAESMFSVVNIDNCINFDYFVRELEYVNSMHNKTLHSIKKSNRYEASRKCYENFLNDLGCPDSDKKSYGGRVPDYCKYGSWVRRKDPIMFSVGFREFLSRNN